MSLRPATADERERRLVQYLLTLHRGQLCEFKLTRLNRIANFRRRLMDLLNQMIETRAEDLAAGMLMEFAPPRPIPEWKQKEITGETAKGRLPLPTERKRRKPMWVVEEGRAVRKDRQAVS